MSRTDVVVQAYHAVVRGDLAALLSVCEPDVEFAAVLSEIHGQPYRGAGGMRRWFADRATAFPVTDMTLGDVEEIDDEHVVSTFTIEVRGGTSGVVMRRTYAQLFRFRGERISFMAVHGSRDEALAAVRSRGPAGGT